MSTTTVRLREKWLRPFWLLLGAVHIRVKILGIVLGLVLLLGLTVIIQVPQLVTQNMYSQLEEQAVSITRDLAARSTDSILINDLYTLQQLLRDTRANHPDVRYAFIISPKGEVLAHTFDNGFPTGLSEANSVSQTAYQHTQILLTDQGKIWDVAVPIFEGRAGIARIGLSDVQVQQTISTLTGQLVLTTVIVSLIGIVAAALLTWLLTRPLLSLVQATKAVERGDFSQRVPVWAADETGELTSAFNAMTAALAKSEVERAERDQLRVQYVSGVITAQEDERKRIARELHDSTSQSLTSLLIGLKNLDDATDLCGIRNGVGELRVIAANTLDDVHALALQLRPSMLDDLGLPEALKRYVLDYQKRYPIHIDLAITGLETQRLPAEIETALYRIAQEALTNIVRHAGAENASVFIERRAERVLAVIEDDGIGFDPSAIDKQTGHLGLYGIRERAELLSGQLVIESESGQGTSLYIEIPLPGGGRERKRDRESKRGGLLL
ncbi:MAG: HAMP domain-containing protein [Chloroflexi bacterium]|nr:HAMP domain-containing protein [Chloroflexota bacterium]OJV99098.1 MAG: ATPase [Chloroflexi bacterium 54-19]